MGMAEIVMLKLNLGLVMLRLRSCMLRLSVTSLVKGAYPGHGVWPPYPADLLGPQRKAELEHA